MLFSIYFYYTFFAQIFYRLCKKIDLTKNKKLIRGVAIHGHKTCYTREALHKRVLTKVRYNQIITSEQMLIGINKKNWCNQLLEKMLPRMCANSSKNYLV